MTQSSKRKKNTSMIFSKSLKKNPRMQKESRAQEQMALVLREGEGVLRHKAHAPAVNMDVTPIMSEGLALEPQEGRPRVRPREAHQTSAPHPFRFLHI